MTVDEAIERAEKLIDDLEDEMPPETWDKQYELFEDIGFKARHLIEFVEEEGKVSSRLSKALKSWRATVDKWLAHEPAEDFEEGSESY